MQDFPALFHYLSLATHSPVIVVAVIVILVLFFRDVIKDLWDEAVKWVADHIRGLFGWIPSLVKRIFHIKDASNDSALTPVQRLAKVIYDELDAERISLKLEAPRPLPISWQRVTKEADVPSSVVTDPRIMDEYSNTRYKRLVILGDPGSGKSVLAQRLALNILGENPERKDYAKHKDKGRPRLHEQIPVIFGLHSWEPSAKLDDWLTGQLMALNYVPLLTKDLAGELVESRQILPILDGFDEINPSLRAEFLKLVNKESERPFILTSRPDEYRKSPPGHKGKNHPVLSNSRVITLTDLSLDDVANYLLDLPLEQDPAEGQASTAVDAMPSGWAPVVAELREENPSPKATILIKALRTPLRVALARDIYEDGDPAELLYKPFARAEDVEKYLLDSFVPAIYAGVSGDLSHRTPRQRKQVEKAERPFRYLAAHLQGPKTKQPDGKQPQAKRPNGIAWWEFAGIGWKSAVQRAILCGLTAGLVMMIANGIATFLAVQGVGALGVTPVQGVVLVLGNSMAIALAFGVVHFLAAWRAEIDRHAEWVIHPSWVGLSIPWLRGNRTVDSWNLTREWGFGFVGGSVGGSVAMFGLLLSNLLADTIGGAPSPASASTSSPGRPAMLLAALGVTLIFGLTAGNVAALQAPVEIESAGGPLELLDADRRLALGGGAVVGIGSGAAIGCLIGVEQGPFVGLGYAVVGCATVWLGGAISVTAWGQWIIWGRLLRPLSGKLPWRTRAFLRDAHKRGVLRQSGAYYQFRHSLLQELYEPPRTPRLPKRHHQPDSAGDLGRCGLANGSP